MLGKLEGMVRLLRRRAVGTAMLTLGLAAALALVNWRGSLTVRGALGFEQTAALADLWRLFFRRLPATGPGILGPTPLAIGLVVAALAFAYVLAATLRLPE